jgi:hypothetical protein
MRLTEQQVNLIRDTFHSRTLNPKQIKMAQFCREQNLDYNMFYFWATGRMPAFKMAAEFEKALQRYFGIELEER